ncbi:MAG TPA: type II secretion system protein N [Gammaproteobacteria bacterium]|nr:type II secretion system protein N [Gammaproteobacteria bacterium]
MTFFSRTSYLPLLVFGLLAYLVALVISFPAQRAYAHWRASEQASDSVALSGISGSVWSGRAALALINGQPLENLEWHLRPWSVLFGEVGLGWRVQLPEAGGYAQADSALGLDGSISFDTLEARLPAAMIARLARAAALRPTGTVNLNLHDVQWDGKTLRSAVGRVVWNDAGISLLKPIALGDQSLTLETTEEGVKGVLSDGGGPLSLDGLLIVDAEGKYTFSGSLAARNAPDLERALRSLGRPGPDGRITLKRSGTLASLGLFY